MNSVDQDGEKDIILYKLKCINSIVHGAVLEEPGTLPFLTIFLLADLMIPWPRVTHNIAEGCLIPPHSPHAVTHTIAEGCDLMIPLLMEHLKLHLKPDSSPEEKELATKILTHILITVANKHVSLVLAQV